MHQIAAEFIHHAVIFLTTGAKLVISECKLSANGLFMTLILR